MRRAMRILLAALLMAAISVPALAISGQEALFGTADGALSVQSDSDSYTGADSPSDGQYPTLKLGDSDGADSTAYIVFMQNRLIQLGYLRDAADGVYGEATQDAVLAFQRNNNLPETGIADCIPTPPRWWRRPPTAACSAAS